MRSEKYLFEIPPEPVSRPKVQEALLKIPFESRKDRIDKIEVEFDWAERETTLTLQGVVSYGGQRIVFKMTYYKNQEEWEGDYDHDIVISRHWINFFLPDEIEELYEKIASLCESFLYQEL